MRKFKSLTTTLVLVLVLSASALAGETQTPPGETSSPPGQTETPPAPGGSNAMGETQGPSLAAYLWAIGLDLVV